MVLVAVAAFVVEGVADAEGKDEYALGKSLLAGLDDAGEEGVWSWLCGIWLRWWWRKR